MLGVLMGWLLAGVRAQQTDPSKPVVVQPGAPGQPSKTLPASTKGTLPPRSQADVEFMQGMIMHHSQAVEMTALIPSHTENKDLRLLGARISSSQSDEIKFMKRWLAARGEPLSMAMPGMPDMDTSGQPMASDARYADAGADGSVAEREGRRVRPLIFDRDDSAPQRRVDHGEGFVRHRGRGAGCRHFQLRDGCGQHAARRDQNYAIYVGKKTLQRRNDEPIAQYCFSCGGGRDFFMFRCEPDARRKRLQPRQRPRQEPPRPDPASNPAEEDAG